MTLYLYSLRIDGVEYRVPGELEIGWGFFMPGLAHKRMMQAVRKHYAALGYRLDWVSRVESDLLGIRVWRVA